MKKYRAEKKRDRRVEWLKRLKWIGRGLGFGAGVILATAGLYFWLLLISCLA